MKRTPVKTKNAPARTSTQLAYVEVGSTEFTRDINRDIVLEYVRAMQPISRVHVARASGLQPSTVSSIVERLLEERWIRESPMVKTARGRRPTLLSLNDDMVFLVADIRPTQAIAAVVDLSGRFLERQMVPVCAHPEITIQSIASVMQAFQARHTDKTFQGVGVSVPGRVDLSTHEMVFAPNLHWQAFPVRARLHALLGLQVQLENDATASLLAELWFGRIDGIRNAVLVTVSEGIGAAILADGRLISGRDGLAGEFGHISIDPDGPVCGCGGRGCWEVFASSAAALRTYRELQPGSAPVSVVQLIALALDGEPSAHEALTQQARAIGRGLHLLNAVMSPDLILLAGDVSLFYDVFRDVIEAECRAGAMDGVGPRLVSVGDGDMSRLRGAAAVVLQRHSGYYRAAHMRADKRSPTTSFAR